MLGSEVITQSAASATVRGLPATRPPIAASASARTGSTSRPTTANPAAIRFRAIAEPILPSPTIPTVFAIAPLPRRPAPCAIKPAAHHSGSGKAGHGKSGGGRVDRPQGGRPADARPRPLRRRFRPRRPARSGLRPEPRRACRHQGYRHPGRHPLARLHPRRHGRRQADPRGLRPAGIQALVPAGAGVREGAPGGRDDRDLRRRHPRRGRGHGRSHRGRFRDPAGSRRHADRPRSGRAADPRVLGRQRIPARPMSTTTSSPSPSAPRSR